MLARLVITICIDCNSCVYIDEESIKDVQYDPRHKKKRCIVELGTYVSNVNSWHRKKGIFNFVERLV